MKLVIKYRYGTIYREVLHTEFEWCGFVDGTSFNPIANVVPAILKKSPELFKGCPFQAVSRSKPQFFILILKGTTFAGHLRVHEYFLQQYELALCSTNWQCM